MANSKQARKRARQSTARNQHNTAQRSKLRTAIRTVRKAIAGGDKAQATEIFRKATSVIDSIADKKIVHKNTQVHGLKRDGPRCRAALSRMQDRSGRLARSFHLGGVSGSEQASMTWSSLSRAKLRTKLKAINSISFSRSSTITHLTPLIVVGRT